MDKFEVVYLYDIDLGPVSTLREGFTGQLKVFGVSFSENAPK